MSKELQDAIAACDAALRLSWERDAAKAPRAKPLRYSVTFTAEPDVAARILQFIAEQPAWGRSFRRYEIGEADGR